MKKKLNILVAEDHEFFVDGITNHLKSFDFINNIYTARNGAEASLLINDYPIDFLITDVDMPVLNGIELSKRIKKEKSHIKIIIVTQYTDRRHIKPLLNAGVDAIVDKINAKQEIGKALKKALAGENFYTQSIQQVIVSIATGKKKDTQQGVILDLTAREQELLPFIAAGLSNKEIVKRLKKLPEKIVISEHTVEWHRKNLYLKFDAHNAAQLAKKARDFDLLD